MLSRVRSTRCSTAKPDNSSELGNRPFLVTLTGNADRLAVSGEVDLCTAPAIVAAALASAQCRELTIDLGGVVFIDAAGITGLITVHNIRAAAGRTLCVTGAAPRITRTFALARAGWLLTRARSDPRVLDQLTAAIVSAASAFPSANRPGNLLAPQVSP